jgi:hypothetical protein
MYNEQKHFWNVNKVAKAIRVFEKFIISPIAAYYHF